MNYEFPIIKTLDDLLPAIKGRNEFVVAERDWGFVVNYNVAFEDTFGDGKSITSALRRECRGIKFGLNGKLISRPYHKFFNLNEREETQSHNVNFSNPFMILDKLDGSMLHPMMPDGTAGDIVWCTKMGPTDIAQAAALRIPTWLNNWVRDCISEGHTPIFEWCSRSQRIVIDYPQDQLVLTAIRNNKTGRYLPYSALELANNLFQKNLSDDLVIRIVHKWNGTFTDINNFANYVKDLENIEGYVIRFNNGQMLKLKNLWYLQLHKTKELMSNEKDIWALILDDKVDDAKAFMSAEEAHKISEFQKDLISNLQKKADELKWEVLAWRDNNSNSKKKFAIEFVNSGKFKDNERGLLFKMYDQFEETDDANAESLVLDFVRKNVSTGSKLELVRHFADNIRWEY